MKNVRKHSVWIALGVLAVLAVWLYFDLKAPVREPDQNLKISELVGLKPDEVTRIEAVKDGKSLVLAKDGSDWRLEEPVKAPADSETVKRAVEDILDQTTDYVMEEPPKDLARYGLAVPKRTITLTGKEGKKVVLQIGDKDPGKSSVFTRLADGGKIFLMVSYAAEGLLDKTADDFRDKTVLSIARENIERIHLTGPKGAVTLAKTGGKWSVTEPIKVPADEFSADGVADALANLKAERFAAASVTDLARYGLDKPKLTAEVHAKGGARYTVHVGKEVASAGNYYAARAGENTVVEISRTTFDSLNKSVGDLRSRKVVDATTDKVVRVAVTSRKANWEAAKSGDDWKFVRPNAGKKADAIDIDNLILDVTASADRWVADNPSEADLGRYGLVKPEITVTLTLKGGAVKRLEVGKKSASGDYFVRGTDTGSSIFALGSYVVDRLTTMPKVAK